MTKAKIRVKPQVGLTYKTSPGRGRQEQEDCDPKYLSSYRFSNIEWGRNEAMNHFA
jgi:hypothetical protein